MARTSGSRLTKYVSGSTVVTAEVANSWYGGLYGTSEGDQYEEGDPLVAGHVHDGVNKDGHAQKINLVDHVTGQLRNNNLADEAVTKRNVQSFLDVGSAIPEYVVDGYDTYYYLDLSQLRSEIIPSPFITEDNVTSNSPGDMSNDDFVFGSDSLDDDGDSSHDSRLFFDKSKSAFRAGIVEDDSWDESNLGEYSIAFGKNNKSNGEGSSILGGEDNSIVTSNKSVIIAGKDNAISTNSTNSLVGSGSDNSIDDSGGSFVGAGGQNNIDQKSESSFIGAGFGGSITSSSTSSFIGAGVGNEISTSDFSLVGSGRGNSISGSNASIIVGGGIDKDSFIDGNQITGGKSHGILSGNGNSITDGFSSAIISGDGNTISNQTTVDYFNIIGAGSGNSIENSISSSIISGSGNLVQNGTYSIVGSGTGNEIQGAIGSAKGFGIVICGGISNIVAEKNPSYTCNASFIGGGNDNSIQSIASDSFYGTICGGESNSVYNSYGTIPGGFENVVNSLYGFASGKNSVARSYAERVFSSGSFPSANGSSQESTLIFFKSLASGSDTFDLYLDGASEIAFLPEDVCLYMTFDFLVVSNAGSNRYGTKVDHIIINNGGTISNSASSYYNTINGDSGAVWTVDPYYTGLGNYWRVRVTRDSNTSETYYATCIARGVYIKFA
jgi:hypothetical protein